MKQPKKNTVAKTLSYARNTRECVKTKRIEKSISYWEDKRDTAVTEYQNQDISFDAYYAEISRADERIKLLQKKIS